LPSASGSTVGKIMGVFTNIVVESRNLDTDERSRRTYELEAQLDIAGLHDQLERLVRHIHPGARVQGFADGVGTFADRRAVIVARRLDHAGPPDPADQDRLFPV
jgi:hypothetical protein